ncbi:MAG TPA: M4 family peptidase, partial [Amycolatopsis sp.]|nr:M4 family peptidase [Amycolatopsis sp.]
MHLRRPIVLAASGALIAAVCTTTTAQAQPTTPNAVPDAQTLAVSAAAGLVASRPAALHASADDVFLAQQAISATNGLKYIPYERSYKGLAVVGGDFVVATDSTGRVLGTSVAQDQPIDLATTTAKVSKETAEATARQQLAAVDSVSPAQEVVYALGTPTLAWKSTVVGRDAEGPSRLDVVVDAATGKVLRTQEHVMHGDGTSAYNRPNPVHLDTTQSG